MPFFIQLGHGEAGEELDEPRELDVVDVGERRLELRHPMEDPQKLRVLHPRVVVADRARGEEGAEVQELAARP